MISEQAVAENRARIRNKEIGATGDDERYAIAVQQEDGTWTVEERRGKKSLLKRIGNALLGGS